MSAREDPRRQAAHADYIAELDREHHPALPTVAEVLKRLGT